MNADLPVPNSLAEITVDVAAITSNVRQLSATVGPEVAMMSIVKADGYGHGMIESARAARAGGAAWLGVATLGEALELRRHGDSGPVLCWLAPPNADFASVIRAGVDVTASGIRQLQEIATAAESINIRARVQLKVDTGLSRNGCPESDWSNLFEQAAALQASQVIEVTGIWSHLACADQPEHPANDEQESAFERACDLALASGLSGVLRHLANSAAALWRPSSRFDLVRCGISTYGLSPDPDRESSAALGLTPAMTVSAVVVNAKDLHRNAGISYGHTYTTDQETRVALVPLGYGDGIPRHASNRAQVLVNQQRAPIRGR
ncbi:MAG TPA: alanine racemase, partial [Marmoricola sp.]|nr:alanine racemase [Marmoricola sp.]